MLEWLEVRLDVGCDKRLVYEYRIEPLKCDRDALKQECRLARIACSGTQPPTHLSENIQRARSYCPESFERDWYKKKALGPGEQEYLASFRLLSIILAHQHNAAGMKIGEEQHNGCNGNHSFVIASWKKTAFPCYRKYWQVLKQKCRFPWLLCRPPEPAWQPRAG